MNPTDEANDSAVLTKSASSAAGRDRLRHEYAMLTSAQHPGVIRVCDFTDGDRTQLCLVRVNAPTLAESLPEDASVAHAIVAALARVVADLHTTGVAHRRLQADHVLRGANDRPLLCGFAEATDRATPEDIALDDAALVALVEMFVAYLPPERRRAGRSRKLQRLVEHARRHERKTGAPLAAANLARMAGATTARKSLVATTRSPRRPHANQPREPQRAASHKLAAFAIVPLVVAIVVLASGVPTGTMALDASNAAGANAPDTTRPLVRPTSSVLAVPTTTPTTTASPHVNATTTTATTAAAPARPSDHPVRIRVGDTTFEVGEVGDDVAVADWLCTGEPAAVLLRRSTGEVFLFAALPDSGEAFTGRLLEVVHDAASIVPQRTDATCPILAIADHTGATHEIGAR